MLELRPYEAVDLDNEHIYTKMWCDGNGNLGPCSCLNGPRSGGHWRSGRRIPLEEYVRMMVEKAVRETIEACAEYAGERVRSHLSCAAGIRYIDPESIVTKVLEGGM